MVNCENCSSTEVSKAPMAPSVQSNTQMQPSDKFLSALRAYVNKSFHDVGNDFADTVRKISSGEMEPRPIRGTASKEDYDQLLDEGHDVIKLMLKKDN